jgi:DNA-directed RNA polymerase subunit RPC12/RpoP
MIMWFSVLFITVKNDIECAECGRRFSTKQYLKNHMSIHQNNSYKCKFCPKIFTLAFNRKRHERSHSSKFHISIYRQSFYLFQITNNQPAIFTPQPFIFQLIGHINVIFVRKILKVNSC